MIDAVFNGIDLALIAAALLGAVLVMYAQSRVKLVATVRDRDPLEEVFRDELAFRPHPRVYDQEG